VPRLVISLRLINRCSRLPTESHIRIRGGSLPGPAAPPSGLNQSPDSSNSQTTSATRDVAGVFVSPREYALKPLERVHYALASPRPWSVLVSSHHTSGKLRVLAPPLGHSAGKNVLPTPPSSRCFYPLNGFLLHKHHSPCSAESSSHVPAEPPHPNAPCGSSVVRIG